jgi:trk system potassium uptake protein
MNVIVIGCGRVGAAVAHALFKKGHKVSVIDSNAKAFGNLPPDFRGQTLRGEVLAGDVLLRAGIEHAHAVAVVTPSDSMNAVVAHMVRTVYKVPNVVVRNYEPRKRPLHDAFGFHVISPSTWGAQRIEEMLSSTAIQTVSQSRDGEIEILEVVVPKAWSGKALVNIGPPGQVFVASITRAGRSFLPKAGERVQAGDVLQLSATRSAVKVLREELERVQEV